MLDLATCAAAEQHAEVPCVTASVLDLVFELDVVTEIGDLLVVRESPLATNNLLEVTDGLRRPP